MTSSCFTCCVQFGDLPDEMGDLTALERLAFNGAFGITVSPLFGRVIAWEAAPT